MLTSGRQTLTHKIQELRRMRRDGMRASDIVRTMKASGINEFVIFQYLEQAFMLERSDYFVLVNPLHTGVTPTDDEINTAMEAAIDGRAAQWNAEMLPELLRLRDAASFLEFASQTGNIVVVCGSDARAGQFVGRQGFRPWPLQLYVSSGENEENLGLAIADPNDVRLSAYLEGKDPKWSYEHYVDELGKHSMAVASANEGYVVRNRAGEVFYKGYYLHGVYNETDFVNAWTRSSGEKLRAMLNQRLGEELIQLGPHDTWEHRNVRGMASLLFGPQLPVTMYWPSGRIQNCLTLDDLKFSYRRANWTSIYPFHR